MNPQEKDVETPAVPLTPNEAVQQSTPEGWRVSESSLALYTPNGRANGKRHGLYYLSVLELDDGQRIEKWISVTDWVAWRSVVNEQVRSDCRLPARWDHVIARSMGPPDRVSEHGGPRFRGQG